MIKKTLRSSTFLLVCLMTMCCKRDIQVINPKAQIIETPSKPIKINKINFYFENSGSMNGYLNGDDFQQTVRRILKNTESDSLNPYFVNTKEYFEPNIIDRIAKKNIKTSGIENSDHEFIFTNAIKYATGNNLSIVITDGIYSMKDGNIALVEIDIEAAFKKALKVNEIETVVLKMSSNFNGIYYSETCEPGHKAIPIDQARPYYILLFGNKEVINKALDEIVVIDNLTGYKEQARFIITKDLTVNYSVLTQGDELKGKFRAKDHSPLDNVKEIEEAEKYSRSGVLLKDRYLQFGIAVDYSNLSIPKSYLNDSENYFVQDNTGYNIEEIKVVDELDKSSKSYKWIDKLNKKGKFKYTHILVVKGKTQLYGDLKINLNINFPNWIEETGSKNDCQIKDDSNTTFAFDRLMNGISKAYKKVSKKEEFFDLEIKIKAD